jgi:hypothetical protein
LYKAQDGQLWLQVYFALVFFLNAAGDAIKFTSEGACNADALPASMLCAPPVDKPGTVSLDLHSAFPVSLTDRVIPYARSGVAEES